MGNVVITPRAGFDWSQVKWGGPKQRRTTECSFCAAPFGDDEVPLVLWKDDGSAAEFCEGCQEEWWSVKAVGPLTTP